MELFIRLQNGQPFEHPIEGNNFRQAFPKIDVNNLPENFARFERLPIPTMGVYEVYEGVSYEWVDGIVKDVHHVRAMTQDEKEAKQNAVKERWADRGFASWIFDEDTCSFKPPIPMPNDGLKYQWDEETTSWEVIENG